MKEKGSVGYDKSRILIGIGRCLSGSIYDAERSTGYD